VLMLAVIRLCWRLYDGTPGYGLMNRAIVAAAHTVHYLLYAMMFIMPLTGWSMSSAAGHNPTFFGLFTFPSLFTNAAYVGTFYALHSTCAMLLLTLFILHVSGALFHHLILKDKILRRMTVE